MISRRCTQRQLLSRPSADVNQILGYCLAVAAGRYGIAVHAYCFLSNHVHLVLTDMHGNYPEFLRWLFEFTAKCLNAYWGRWENLWAAERPSVVELVDAKAQLKKTIYTIANPVKANLVASARRWPGLVSLPTMTGQEQTFKRPRTFFRASGPLPAEANFQTQPLPAFAEMKLGSYIALLKRALEDQEEELALNRRREGTKLLGRREVLRQSPFARPQSQESRRQLNPSVATRNKWARIEALGRLKEFVASYRNAWRRWRDGDHDVMFPYGTYALRLFSGVQCAGPPVPSLC